MNNTVSAKSPKGLQCLASVVLVFIQMVPFTGEMQELFTYSSECTLSNKSW